MRFKLIYDGELGSSGNSSSKPGSVLRIREQLSGQIERLWQTHNALRVLRETAIIQRPDSTSTFLGTGESASQLQARYPDHFMNLAGPISVGSKSYTPLVRPSLALACELQILFLRDQDPGDMFSQGGDLDNRIKTLFDALRMPKKDEQDNNPPAANHLFCLLEDDSLISDFAVNTDRLLRIDGAKQSVLLVIDVRLNVLQVSNSNVCLL